MREWPLSRHEPHGNDLQSLLIRGMTYKPMLNHLCASRFISKPRSFLLRSLHFDICLLYLFVIYLLWFNQPKFKIYLFIVESKNYFNQTFKILVHSIDMTCFLVKSWQKASASKHKYLSIWQNYSILWIGVSLVRFVQETPVKNPLSNSFFEVAIFIHKSWNLWNLENKIEIIWCKRFLVDLAK